MNWKNVPLVVKITYSHTSNFFGSHCVRIILVYEYSCYKFIPISSRHPNFFDRLKHSMFEARLENSSLLKKLFDAVKELCKDVRFDCNENGIALQAMDRYGKCYPNS